MQYSRDEILRRYRINYNIKPESPLSVEMVERHWALEKDLRSELLGATPDKRAEVFEECYTRLYTEFEWLNTETNQDLNVALEVFYEPWIQLIGSAPKCIYEVGSGKAELLKLLAMRGHHCKATEITRERGKVFAPEEERLIWGASDGIHLDRFELESTYDVVISNQVIEHMHPDDVLTHFRAVHRILKGGGRYIFATPQRLLGPADVSAVFGSPDPLGMHLKEYTHADFTEILASTGFTVSQAVIRFPKKIRQMAPAMTRAYPSVVFLAYLCLLERLMGSWPARFRKTVSRGVFFPKNVMMVAQKSS